MLSTILIARHNVLGCGYPQKQISESSRIPLLHAEQAEQMRPAIR
jgi:hypothetical protein